MMLNKSPYLNIEYLGILIDSTKRDNKNLPLQLKKIRQAINYGFDKDAMILYLRNSIGRAATAGFIPPGLPAFNATVVKGYNYNPQKARQLLQEAGYSNKNPLPTITLHTIATYADLANFIARQLQDVGIKVKIEVVQKAFLLDMAAQSKASFFRASWIADYPDAENYLQVFYSKNPAPPNYTRYSNPAFDQLLNRAIATTQMTEKNKLYQQADQLLINDAPVVPLWYDEVIHLVQPNIKNFAPNALNMLELRWVKIN